MLRKMGISGARRNYFSRYLALVPTDPDALARYGLLLSDPKLAKTPRDLNRALNVLERAVLRDPSRNDLRRRVVRMGIDLGRYTNARDDIKDRLLKEFPNDGELERCWLNVTNDWGSSRASVNIT